MEHIPKEWKDGFWRHMSKQGSRKGKKQRESEALGRAAPALSKHQNTIDAFYSNPADFTQIRQRANNPFPEHVVHIILPSQQSLTPFGGWFIPCRCLSYCLLFFCFNHWLVLMNKSLSAACDNTDHRGFPGDSGLHEPLEPNSKIAVFVFSLSS